MPHKALPLLAAAVLLGGAHLAVAHHSFGEFDQSQLVEIEGTIARVQWQNPHVHVFIDVPGEGLFDLESAGANQLRRMGIEQDRFTPGRRVKVAGFPSRRRTGFFYTAHLLQDDGQELVLFRNLAPRWTNDAVGFNTASDPDRAGAPRGANGTIFGVWGSQLSNPDANPAALARGAADYPYTPAARQLREEWLKEQRPPLSGCTPKGMPLIMEQPFPIEFVDRGSSILLRMEEYDTERVIRMDGQAPAIAPEPTPLGHSYGRWEGPTLVVETLGARGEFLDQLGTPQGANAYLVERFTPSADGTRLDYTLTVTDPETFTAPVEMRRSWLARPGERLLPFRCSE